MRYDPNSVNANLIPSGTWCQAEIVSATEKQSRAGKDMIQVDFLVYDPAGLHPTVTTYLVPDKPGFIKKLCAVIDIDLSTGELHASRLVGKTMWVLIKIQEDKTGQFDDKNVVAAFSKEPPADVKAIDHNERQATNEKDDGTPF